MSRFVSRWGVIGRLQPQHIDSQPKSETKVHRTSMERTSVRGGPGRGVKTGDLESRARLWR